LPRPAFGAPRSATTATGVAEEVGERAAALRADVDRDVVALLQVGGGTDVRHAVRPDENLALHAERE